MVGVGYLVDGVDCHAVVSFFVGGDEEDAVVGVEGFPVEEGGDGSHCCCSLSAFNNDWGVSLVGLVVLGGGGLSSTPFVFRIVPHICDGCTLWCVFQLSLLRGGGGFVSGALWCSVSGVVSFCFWRFSL